MFSGVTAAFVFLDLLPSLEQSTEYVADVNDRPFLYGDLIFLVVFIGFLLFFTLESIAAGSQKSKDNEPSRSKEQTVGIRVYFVHFSALAFLQFVLSYSLIFEYQSSIVGGFLYTFVISLHLLVADGAMIEKYQAVHTRNGRYIATVTPLLGLVASLAFPEKIVEAYLLLAFISGAVLYQSIYYEIPIIKKRRSLFLFLFGAITYALLILIYEFASGLL